MNSRSWLRWILVVPGSIAAMLVVNFLSLFVAGLFLPTIVVGPNDWR
jgi:hypothetical protein